jgi:hypothetical protein
MPALKSASVVTTALIGLGALVSAAPATAAPAAPSGGYGTAAVDCRAWVHGYGGSSKCTGLPSGQRHRVVVECRTNGGSVFTVTGPWRVSGQTSTQVCHPQGLHGPTDAWTQRG